MAFITNNSFLSGKSHYKMRESSYKAFDEIHILNLHGNNDEDPANDKNVFDIKFDNIQWRKLTVTSPNFGLRIKFSIILSMRIFYP